jgi:hypothetical protein
VFQPAILPTAFPQPQQAPAFTAGKAQPCVEEFLLCTVDGDVLYKWQCEEYRQRIEYLAKLYQAATEISAAVGIGELDRVEMESHTGRAIARIEEQRAVFLRATKPQNDLINNGVSK